MLDKTCDMGRGRFALGIISKRADSLKRSLTAYDEALRRERGKGWMLIVRDDDSSFAKNAELLRGLSKDCCFEILHLSPQISRSLSGIASKSVGRDISPLFQENYGGCRNSVLLAAAALGLNVVFADDDTSPLYDFFKRYERLFDEGWSLVPGGYEGDVNISGPAALYELSSVLNEWRAGDVSEKDARASIGLLLHGIPRKKGSYSVNMFTGGNIGISLALLKRCPFFPTPLRVEDVIYGEMAAYFLSGEARGVFSPGSYDEAYSRVPLAQHERARSQKPSLASAISNELRGSTFVKVVLELGFDSFERQTALPETRLLELEGKAARQTWGDFNMRNHLANIRESIGASHASSEFSPKGESIGIFDGELKAEAERILALDESSAQIPLPELKGLLDSFSFTVKAWPYVMGALEDGKVRKEILEALGAKE